MNSSAQNSPQKISDDEVSTRRKEKEQRKKEEKQRKLAISYEENLTKAREQLRALLDVAGIKWVICVDDNYAESTTSYEEALTHFNQLSETEELDSVISQHPLLKEIDSDAFKEMRSEDFQRIWESSTAQDKRSILAVLKQSDTDIAEEQEYSETALYEIFNGIEGVNFARLSLESWLTEDEALVQKSQIEPTLFLFDRDCSREAESIPDSAIKDRIGDAGIECMNRVCKATESSPSSALCGLISFTLDGTDEQNLWRDRTGKDLRDQIDSPTRCVPIPRACLGDSPDSDGSRFQEFVRRIKFTLISHPLNQLLQETREIYSQAVQSAKNKIDEISVYSLDHLLFRKSISEGLWEPDTLFRVFGLYSNKEAQRRARDNQNIKRLVEEIRPLSDCPVLLPTDKLGTSAHNALARLEMYEEGEHINTHHLPLEAGDLFEVQDEDNRSCWILLNQSCDLMVRHNSNPDKSGVRKMGYFNLVQVQLSISGSAGDAFIEEIPYFNADVYSSAYVDWRTQTPIKSWVLDLCVFQSDGVSLFSIDEERPLGLSRAWADRYEQIKSIASEVLAAYEEIRRVVAKSNIKKTEKEKLLQRLRPLQEQNTPFFINLVLEEKSLNFGIRRVGRVLPPKTISLLESLHRYNSRLADNMDLGEGKSGSS